MLFDLKPSFPVPRREGQVTPIVHNVIGGATTSGMPNSGPFPESHNQNQTPSDFPTQISHSKVLPLFPNACSSSGSMIMHVSFLAHVHIMHTFDVCSHSCIAYISCQFLSLSSISISFFGVTRPFFKDNAGKKVMEGA